MSVVMTLYLAALFVALTPGVLVKLPFKGKKLTVALTHAVLFAVVYQLTNTLVSQVLEGFGKTQDIGGKCNNEDDCLSKYCNQQTKKCDKKCTTGDGTLNALCKQESDCKSNLICNFDKNKPKECGKCATKPSSSYNTDSKKRFGEPCSKDSNCITNICKNGMCDKNCEVGDGTWGSLCKRTSDCSNLGKDAMCFSSSNNPADCGKCSGVTSVEFVRR